MIGRLYGVRQECRCRYERMKEDMVNSEIAQEVS